MKLIVQQLWPGDRAPGEWRTIGHATTMRGALRIVKRHPQQAFGGFRHPGGGPRYGTVRVIYN